MNYLITIIGVILTFFVFRLYLTIKARCVTRNFFKLAEFVQNEYKDYEANKDQQIESPQEILNIANETISYCEGSGLLEFEEPTIIQTYTDLKNIMTELRRDLWLKNATKSK